MGIVVKTSFQDQIGDLGKLYVKKEFTGGSSDALDSIDGSVLKNGVFALVLKDGKAYSMEYVEGAAGGEDPPNIVTPDSNPTGRWILRGIIYDTDASGTYAVSPTPEANEIPLLNNNGQLWLPLNQSPILISGQDMMYRFFYVDAVNGDDSNDGSESAPFATLQKAIDSVPVGGLGDITLRPGEYTITQHITVFNKVLRITGYTSSPDDYIITHTTYDDNNYCYGLRPVNSVITFYGCNLKTYSGTVNSSHNNTSLLGRHNDSSFGQITCYFCKIELNNADLVSISFGGGTLDVSLNLCDVIVNTTEGKLFRIEDGRRVASFSVHDSNLTDNTGNNYDWADLITGIVKDANGVPRNILSNIVL